MVKNLKLLDKALQLLPEVKETVVEPLDIAAFLKPLKKGDSVEIDFGRHLVGHIKLKLGYVRSHPDAPVWLRFSFAENKKEFEERVEDYQGWICSAWVQQEQVHIDLVPGEYFLPRRYSFRYVKIEVLDVSSKFDLIIEEAKAVALSSADDSRLSAYHSENKELEQLDRIACNTLHDCMQKVFEDGPKRDQRLWMGDLRLQALANYETYQMNDMVKGCLYLFGALPMENGQVGACVFLDPEPEVDDTSMFDYSLLYVVALWDYYKQTKDKEALRDLWETARTQISLAQKRVDAECLKGTYEVYRKAAKAYFYDEKKGLFVSGENRQISYASQVWLILGGVVDSEEGLRILHNVAADREALEMVTPYMYHYYIEALLKCNADEEALAVLTEYWGGMARLGADTFWELYNPKNPDESPYGGTIVNSYCHAWSCAPAYFLRKYFGEN